ncbi:hypothetical protein WA026_004144 [Henosepilachna vigintioctopunctata]|uniref:DDE Tnp4 domain-containing protein n=1 Tax=Henosepilachna vigintioctopunctata TaxID=420089 RepID=A0AAW1U9H1_9CUCU
MDPFRSVTAIYENGGRIIVCQLPHPFIPFTECIFEMPGQLDKQIGDGHLDMSISEEKKEFSKEETQQTYSVIRVRIYVERIMQRPRTYQILNEIPENLLNCVDDIMHIGCVLVNSPPPIIADKRDSSDGE